MPSDFRSCVVIICDFCDYCILVISGDLLSFVVVLVILVMVGDVLWFLAMSMVFCALP